MTPSTKPPLGSDSRGASDVIATVLLVTLALLGAVLVVVFGSTIVDQVEEQNNRQTAQLIVQEVDSRFSTLTQLNDVSRVEFTIGDTDPEDADVVTSGSLTVMVNRNTTCRSTAPLTALRYQNRQGDTVAYEAGGVWRSSGNTDASSMVTTPDLHFRNGTLSVTVVNISGTIDEQANEALIDTESSREQSNRLTQQVLQGSCIRPDNLTVKVSSDYYRAWGTYLSTEFDAQSRTFEHNRSTLVYIPQDQLPAETDDAVNDVVNLSRDASGDPRAAYMSDVTIQDQTIAIDKAPSNDEYIVDVRPLRERYPEIGRIKEIVDSETIYRRPLDVTFVMDVSGSMSNDPNGDGNSKSEDAQVGAASFVSELNASFDRSGLVVYDQYTDIRTSGGQYLTTQRGSDLQQGNTAACGSITGPSINRTICQIADYPGGGTHIWAGIEEAHKLFDLTSNQTRDKIMVVLTDGRNDGCDSDDVTYDCNGNTNTITRDAAIDAARSNITIYTIGYGDEDDVSDGLLEDVAQETGGEYNFAEDADELAAIFEDIAEQAKETRLIARQPLSTRVSEGGTVHAPFIPGDTDTIASDSTGSTDFVNVNDPTAPSLFRHRFTLTGGESVDIDARWYGCEDDAWRQTPYSDGADNASYTIVRCSAFDTDDVNSLGSDDVSIYTSGEDVSGELTNTSAWWQTNMTDTLVDAGVLADRQATTVELDSNQAIAVLDFGLDDTNFDNRMVVVYEVGLSESEAQPEDIVNIRVRNVELD